MNRGKIIARRTFPFLGMLAVAVCGSAGCQNAGGVSEQRLINHQVITSRTGLQPALRIDSVQVRLAVPEGWRKTPVYRSLLFTDEQWHSPTKHSALGVFHCGLPVPLSLDAVAWILEQEVSQRTEQGQLISKQKDGLGRVCFEAEDARFHVWGFLTVHGQSVWIAYYGYRIWDLPQWDELRLAARSADGAVPLFDSPTPSPPENAEPDAGSVAAGG